MKLKWAYYNEIDPKAAAWLRELMKAGLITDGVVDERSIEDVTPDDVRGFLRVGFFAGIGVWDYALRQAGWPEDWPVWHGSCPCQPFSAAGKGDGFLDIRHLWPAFYHLISECRPEHVFGEQVASKAVDAWIDLVHADLEAVGYAFGSVPFPSAGVGAPHIRDRNYWVADSTGIRQQQLREGTRSGAGRPRRALCGGEERRPVVKSTGNCKPSGLGNNNNKGLERHRSGHQAESGRIGEIRPVAETGESGGLADTRLPQRESQPNVRTAGILGASVQQAEQRDVPGGMGAALSCAPEPGPTNGHWRDADWLFCRDGKWRPVEPGTFPLAHGSPARVGRLRGFGNAINAKAAQEFIEAYLDTCLL